MMIKRFFLFLFFFLLNFTWKISSSNGYYGIGRSFEKIFFQKKL